MYLVEVVGSGGKEVLREVVENHVVEEENDHEEIGLRVFVFELFLAKTISGLVEKGLLIILIY